MVDVGGTLSPHVGRLPVESMGRGTKVGVLGTTPRRVLVDPRMRHSVARVVVRRPHICRGWGERRVRVRMESGTRNQVQGQGQSHSQGLGLGLGLGPVGVGAAPLSPAGKSPWG